MLRLDRLTRHFGDTVAVDDLSLEVRAGEFLTLLGPSGCGKTTTLRMVAGFEHPTAGQILLDGRDVTALPPQRRGVGMVFQNYALFPHLDVFENVAFGLRSRGADRAGIAPRVERALALVELGGYARRKVQALSGGQQQRVALARALAPEPGVLLLDEPLSNLDAALRERTRTELRTLLKRLDITAVFVTHDQEEAFALSDRIALLSHGQLQQLGTPEQMYLNPANPFVAGFLGRANFFDGRVERTDGDVLIVRLEHGAHWPARAGTALPPGDPVRVLARPESLRLTPQRDGVAVPPDALTGTVEDRRFAGAVSFFLVRVDGVEVLVQGAAGAAAPGDRVLLRPAEDGVFVFPAGEE